MKKEKGKTGLIVLVVILSILVVGLAFYCLCIVPKIVREAVDNDKIQEENNNQEQNNNNNQLITENELSASEYFGRIFSDNSSVEFYKIEEAKKLIENYKTSCGGFFNELTEERKNEIVLSTITGTEDLCKNVLNNNEKINCISDDRKVKIFKYDDVVNKKKELFGNDENFEKNISGMILSGGGYVYLDEINSVVLTSSVGCDANNSIESGVTDAYTKGNKLYIFTYNFTSPYGLGTASLSKTVHIFEKNNNSYYLTDIIALNNN